MVSQNVLNLVDLAMVGTLGNAAVAAVGVGGFTNFVATAFITGLSAGVQAVAARRKGEGRVDEMAEPLNAAIILATLLGIPWSFVLVMATPTFVPWINPDPEVIATTTPYLQWRLLSVVALGVNFAFRGYWNGISLSKLYLKTLLIIHATNIALNWVLIFGNLGAPAMGAAGAGLGSTIATYVGTVTYFVLGLRHARQAGFLRGFPPAWTMKTVVRLSVPMGIQQTMFALGMLALMWILGHINLDAHTLSTAEVAAGNAVLNVTLVALLPGMGMGMAAASLVGQALGRGDPDDANRWAWDVVKIAVLTLFVLGLPMLLAPEMVVSPFLRDPATLALARLPLRMVGAVIGLDAVGLVLMHALLGAGAARQTMQVSVALQWGMLLPTAFVLGPVLGYGLPVIWGAQVGYRCLLALSYVALWRSGHWRGIAV